MKLAVFCLIIIANISSNGKASLESFTPNSTGILFEDTARYKDASCYRPCKFNVKPRRCYYVFIVESTKLENGRLAITVNGITPGPPINVCVNDIVVVEVRNKVPSQDITIHWHGIEQKGTPYMDGVPMVTQCPIAYGSIYKYAFIASSPGTFFYHSDSVSQQSDGVYGSLIVNQPQPLEPHSSLYDYDRSSENTVLIGATFSKILTGNLEDVSRIRPNALILNGIDDNFKLFVMQGFAYRLRLINAIAIECPVVVTLDQHEVMVIATDGKPVKPVLAKSVQLYPGERMDVVVRASQKTGGYWVNVQGTGICAGLSTYTMLIYSGFNYTSMLLEGQNEVPSTADSASDSPVYGQMLESLHEATNNPKMKLVYLGVDRNKVKFNDADNDFRYISDAIPKKPFFPAPLSLHENGVVQINGKSFLYPNVPILLNPRGVNPESVCLVGQEDRHQEPQCLQLLKAAEGDLLELALVNEGFGSSESYTFHLHGYTMQVMATWQNPSKSPMSMEEFLRLNREGVINRNLLSPPVKDTVTVPNKGYTIVRVKIDRAGAWMLECRSCGLSSLPTAVLITVPQSFPIPVVKSLSKCGSYRPPDVLLN